VARVIDVAAYILNKQGSMTAMKLQKLVYYSQAWSLVWDERPLFQARIEAWANGPVARVLYYEHQGKFRVSRKSIEGSARALSPQERETVDAVLAYYGEKPSQWLSDLTHAEGPWLGARAGLQAGERGNREITKASMAEYYGGL